MHRRKSLGGLVLWLLAVVNLINASDAADWPQWRYDAGRTAASPAELPAELHLLWVSQYSPRKMVWDDPLNQDLMPYDKVFEPVVMGKTMFIGFNDTDKLVALDTETGEEKWCFYADGPVRLPPVAWQGKVFFASDDGHLYCLNAQDGKLVWKHRGGPSERTVIGNERLISTWPARGGPVIMDDTVYFAASIWPFMGTFIYALDAATGKVIWLNDGTSSQYMLQPHRSPAFAGVAPQGALVAIGDRLLVPGGRSVPACFDRVTGKCLYYQLSANGKTGGSFVCGLKDVFFNHHRDKVTSLYRLSDGSGPVRRIGQHPVLTESTYYLAGQSSGFSGYYPGNTIAAIDVEGVRKNINGWKLSQLWEIAVDGSDDLIKAGTRLYAAGGEGITAVELPAKGSAPRVVWTARVGDRIGRLLAADGKLFAVTLSGKIMAFGATEKAPARIYHTPTIVSPSASMTGKALSILNSSGMREGYALFYGVGDGRLLEALACNSQLRIVAVDPDQAKIDALRQRFDAAGLNGKRIALHQGNVLDFQAPPYVASLTVVNDLETAGYAASEEFLRKLYGSIRPYGGVAWLPLSDKEQAAFIDAVVAAKLPGAKVLTYRRPTGKETDKEKQPPRVLSPGTLMLVREGPLPGSAPWTHQYADAANTVKSNDTLVKLPLGLLWFGGSSNVDVLPRHGHGPPEQVIGGRLFIEGMNSLSARDVYTGRVLWKVEFEDLGNFGVYYDQTHKDTPTSTAYNQVHIPGANIRGANYVATLDLVYVLEGGNCRVLDAGTGNRVRTLSLPSSKDAESPQWGYIGVQGDCLVAGAGFVSFSEMLPEDQRGTNTWTDYDRSASKRLVVMDRRTGDVHWTFAARHGLIHNAIAVTDDTVFCLDKHPPYVDKRLKRRGLFFHPKRYRLLALNLSTGKIKWRTGKDIFGTWLSYSQEHDVLLQATRPSRDMVREEGVARMIAYRGRTGSVLWDKEGGYGGPPILHHDTIITANGACSLLTGDAKTRRNPVTDETIEWSFTRQYGCNYITGSEHLLTFRSAAAGYYDLTHDAGTGNFGGFKSSCTSNLVAADGVLNAPDYTRTCSCAYQNQTSLGLVHDPDVEIWTFNPLRSKGSPVRSVGINVGAPGDRLAPDGTLWIDGPNVGGPSPNLPLSVEPADAAFFRHHLSRIGGEGLRWVAASGVIGCRSVSASLAMPTKVLVLTCDSPPTIDGKLDDACWQDAKPIPFLGNLHRRAPLTTAFLKRDSQAVYFGYRRQAPLVNGKPVPFVARYPEPDTKCWRDDDVELFVTDAKREIGLQLAISCAGGSFRGRNELPKGRWSDLKWRGEWNYAVKRSAEEWTAEAAIPLATLRSENIDPAALQINVMSQNLSRVGARYILLTDPGSRGFGRSRNFLPFGDEPEVFPPRAYTVRLHFAEVEERKPGQRLFHVVLQGREVLRNLDVVKEAGGPSRPLVKEFPGITVTEDLKVSLTPASAKSLPPILCGIEVQADGW